tara:strand:- start:194 stop:493 length:300 start_codon:yes stop_codon:yes gene_type:complete
MDKNYILGPMYALSGRTLWNNLVVGNGCSTLDVEKYYTKINVDKGVCEFDYKGKAKVFVIATNNVRIESSTSYDLADLAENLEGVCMNNGCDLVELDRV